MSPFLDRMIPMRVGTEKTVVDGVECTFDIIDREFESRLQYFVGVVDGTKGQYFISDETPGAYRPLVIAHEHTCYKRRVRGLVNYCSKAVLAELALAKVTPEIDWERYVKFRLVCFEHLVRFSTNAKRDPKFLREITASRDLLRGFRF